MREQVQTWANLSFGHQPQSCSEREKLCQEGTSNHPLITKEIVSVVDGEQNQNQPTHKLLKPGGRA